MTAGSPEVLVLGLGNLLLGDDAVGLRLCRMLEAESAAPGADPGVEFVDGGTQGLALLGWLADRESILILDAVALGAPPGTVHVVTEPQLRELRARRSGTAHEGNALELLAAARLIGGKLGVVTVVGIEPKLVATGVGLSAEVERSLPAALEAARQVLADALSRRSDGDGSERSVRQCV